MATLHDSLVSSTARKLSLRQRPDLTARRHYYQGRVFWVVKDPVGLHYYRFEEEEFALLQMLDGDSSLDDLKERFERQFPPKKLPVDELQQFIATLHRSGLVIADVAGQGDQLRKRGQERKRQEWLAVVSNVLAIRFKGIDPERMLYSAIHPWIRWFFTPTAAVCCFMLFGAALLLVLSQFDVFRSRLPAFHQFFGKENWIWLVAAMAGTKVLHEFGHGLSCKHFGGECHEMGVLLLVLTPCLYCNVSDSWMLPNKWHRAMIGAAGMYVELVIASIATFVWWFSEPGLLNQLALNTIFVCSVSTLIFNANPLLRYDGYYILSDLLEIPNLRQKATTILHRKLGAWCLGLEQPDDPFLPRRNQTLFAIYSIASTVYSWVVILSILWFLNKVFEPYGLKIIGQIMATVAIYGMVVFPLWKVYKYFRVPGRIDQVKKKRLGISAAVIGAGVLAFFVVPLPHRVLCTLEVKPEGATSVYVPVAGTLKTICVQPGQRVVAGQEVARLSNIELELAVADLRGRREELRMRLAGLMQQRFRDRQAGMEVPQVQDSLATIDEQLRQKIEEQEKLVLRAPAAGIVFPPPHVPSQGEAEGQLPSWSGTPLDARNIGATLQESTLFCQVGDPQRMEAILVIDQSDVEFVAERQNVDVKLDQLPADTFHSQIAEIAKLDLKVSPRQLSNKSGGALATKTDRAGLERPMSTSYQARVPLEASADALRPGLRGEAKVHVGWMSLGARAWRMFNQTFNFRL